MNMPTVIRKMRVFQNTANYYTWMFRQIVPTKLIFDTVTRECFYWYVTQSYEIFCGLSLFGGLENQEMQVLTTA